MPFAFDHAVIAVDDLEAASARYAAAGFAVSAGGRHTGLGTHNAIIRFGLDYLELLGVEDRAEVLAHGHRGERLVAFLDRHSEGLLGYALRTEAIDALAVRLLESGLEAEGPFPMQRRRPDGSVLAWRLLVPGGVAWRQRWPFFIQWDTPDSVRLEREARGRHANGGAGVAAITMVVADGESAADLYARQLGLAAAGPVERPDLGATGLRFATDDAAIEVVSPVKDGIAAKVLAKDGEGPYELTLRRQQPAPVARPVGAESDAGGRVSPRHGDLIVSGATRIRGIESPLSGHTDSD